MNINFSLEQVLALADNHRVIPVVETVEIADETPVSVFEKLAADKPGSFLLESAAQGVWSRYSFVGVNSRGMLSYDGKNTTWASEPSQSALPTADALSANILEALDQIVTGWTGEQVAGLPPLTAGMVGLIGWDMVRELENLPNRPKPDFVAPVVALVMFRDLVVFDHELGKLLLISNVFVAEQIDVSAEYESAVNHIAELKAGLGAKVASVETSQASQTEIKPKLRTQKSDFLAAIEKAKHFVRIGDVFQVVLAQRFDLETNASPLEVYRELRALNPSPYMYLLNFADSQGEYAVVGSSPEALVNVQHGHAITHPIAGSRPRGKSPEEDQSHADSLIEDAKERAEHLMLVDLARNDLLKVCQPSSVSVTEFMQIHKYSHIMHLVSTVEGELRENQNAVDVFKATFPAGTLSGAPKPRALEIIDELEDANRGIYGGVVGYFDFAGNADLAIAIRTAFMRDGMAYVEAGAGLVLDSVPESEYQETANKAGAPLRAVASATRS
ncbi:MAG: chorismate-binding protein [Micrococcales bacterium]